MSVSTCATMRSLRLTRLVSLGRFSTVEARGKLWNLAAEIHARSNQRTTVFVSNWDKFNSVFAYAGEKVSNWRD